MLLNDFVGSSYDDFVSSDEIHGYYGALHHLQIALQAVLDVSQYIASCKLLGPFKENKEVFVVLAGKKVLSSELGKKLALATGVRNILVHQYESVDPKIIYKIIQKDLGDFDEFVSQISVWLKKEGGDF